MEGWMMSFTGATILLWLDDVSAAVDACAQALAKQWWSELSIESLVYKLEEEEGLGGEALP